jgi:adenylyltransferase/sulfurtransferase
MAVRVFIPSPLRPYTGKQPTVELEGGTVGEVLQNLAARYAELAPHLFTEQGALRSYVNIYLNDEDIRYLEQQRTRVRTSDTVSIVPAIAGGSADVDTDAVHLQNDEILRYSRHLIMPEVGMKGQKRLKASKVLLVGAGGLGSPIGMYLAAAGVGTIGIADFDVVDITNLQRQVLHTTADIGRSKLASAKETINGINPHVEVRTHDVRLSSDNALDILGEYDIIVDGTDNFATRYLVNDACVLLGKPNVYGSIFRFDGQVSVFDARRGPCYRCLYPAPPPPGLVPSCAEGGVLGVLPGIIGSLQALETIKLIIGEGDPLIGKLVLFDALRFTFRELILRKNPDCPVCGTSPTIHALIDYDEFCGIPSPQARTQEHSERAMTVEQLKSRIDRGENVFLLDVREPHEYDIANLNGRLIPLGDLPDRLQELDPGREIVVYCRTGVRSARAVEFLRAKGYSKAVNLTGGIDAWAQKIDRTMPRY